MRGRWVIGKIDPFIPLDRIVDLGVHAGFGDSNALSLAGPFPNALAKGPTLDEAEDVDEKLVANESC